MAGRVAGHAALHDPGQVSTLLRALRTADATEQVAVLLGRDPASRVALDDPGAVAFLLKELRKAGGGEQAEILVDRLPGAGMFRLFCEQVGHLERFHFGREVDGSPSGPGGWEQLE